MRRFTMTLATVVALTVAGSTLAAPKGNGSVQGGSRNGPPSQGHVQTTPASKGLPSLPTNTGMGNGGTVGNGSVLGKKLPPSNGTGSSSNPSTGSGSGTVKKPTPPVHGMNQHTNHQKHVFLNQCAKKCDFGWCFHGKHHRHWTYHCWSPYYRCNVYWCPYACCYFYWCAPHACYYPVSYCPTGVYVY